jgi:hypothetical protein
MMKVTYSPYSHHTNLNHNFRTNQLKTEIIQLRKVLEQYSCNCGNTCAIELVSEAARAEFRVSCGHAARMALEEEKK